MKKYIIRVTETINHEYEVEAESHDAALAAFDRFDDDDLKDKDLDGSTGWDTPWDVEEQS
jgi:hypothetical protein